MDETSLRDFDGPMSPETWRSWKAWTGHQDSESHPEKAPSSLWPLALAIWFLLGFVALASWVRT